MLDITGLEKINEILSKLKTYGSDVNIDIRYYDINGEQYFEYGLYIYGETYFDERCSADEFCDQLQKAIDENQFNTREVCGSWFELLQNAIGTDGLLVRTEDFTGKFRLKVEPLEE